MTTIARFPDVAEAIARLSPRTLTLDGEICVFDAKLVSQFHLLMDRGAELATPPVFSRKALEDVIAGAKLVFPARRLEVDGLAAWVTVQKRGYEGLVAKDERAPYNPAHPSSAWKVKVRHEARFVVVGFAMADTWPYALLVAERVDDQLVYRGRVEFGVGRRVTRSDHCGRGAAHPADVCRCRAVARRRGSSRVSRSKSAIRRSWAGGSEIQCCARS